jgi:regulatory protein
VSPRAAQRTGAPSLKGKALQWLSQREHSRLELERKLGRWQAAQDSRAAQAVAEFPESPVTRATDGVAAADASESLDAINKVLDELAAAGLLSDTRFTQSRLHLRKARFGNRRIEQELKQHGVVPTADQRDELRGSEAQRALALLRKRLRTPAESSARAADTAELPALTGSFDRAQLLKGQRFLAGRGFSSDAIRQALRRLGQAEDDSE